MLHYILLCPSCCVRPGNPTSCLLQTEKYLLGEIQATLPHFLRASDILQTYVLLPQLCTYLQRYSEDEQLCKALIDR